MQVWNLSKGTEQPVTIELVKGKLVIKKTM
jgi:hypothetical protein